MKVIAEIDVADTPDDTLCKETVAAIEKHLAAIDALPGANVMRTTFCIDEYYEEMDRHLETWKTGQ